jgi:L-alanine-DL-glutamate epimerase-like enolase superfamily enzyme
VRIHTDEGLIGLGETYPAAEAAETMIRNSLVPKTSRLSKGTIGVPAHLLSSTKHLATATGGDAYRTLRAPPQSLRVQLLPDAIGWQMVTLINVNFPAYL